MQSLWLPAIQAQLALNKKNPVSALTALQAAASPAELGTSVSSAIFPASIRRTFAGRLTWPPDKANKPPPSSRRSSTTAASSGTAGPEPWRIWAWPVPTPCRRKFFKDRGRSRRRPRSRPRRLQRLPYPLERRRPQSPHPEASQSRIREAAITGTSSAASPVVCQHSKMWVGLSGRFSTVLFFTDSFEPVFHRFKTQPHRIFKPRLDDAGSRVCNAHKKLRMTRRTDEPILECLLAGRLRNSLRPGGV